ncbi:DUF2802 domain-containing protein [Alteromonas sp. H39]|uniref:DUF2802 domain-containing protein n=1 Tax=Alteromonas sp. H39 TaxID=3389876 RepID=UPI0039DF8A18
MLAPTADNLIMVALFLVPLVVLVVVLLIMRRQQRVLAERADNAEKAAVALADEVRRIAHQQNEDQTRTVVVTKHLKAIEEKQTQLENQMREVKQQDPAMRLYQRAAEMAKSGASIDEIMQACDIPPAEAELLVSMHKG